MSIDINLSTGKLDRVWDGHYYNNHVLEYERVNSTNPSSEMVEINVSCRMCGQYESERIYVESEPHIWTIHALLVSRFFKECDRPQKKIERATDQVMEKYMGRPATSNIKQDIKDDIKDRADLGPNVKIQFV